MKKNVILLLLFFASALQAQITFTRSDYGQAGDKVIYAIDSPVTTNVSVGFAGANQSWKFKFTQKPKRYDSIQFIAATTDPNAPGVAVNMLLHSVAGGDQYEEVAANYVKQVQDMPSYHVFGIKLKTLNFPLIYQSTVLDSTTATTKGLLSEFGISPITGVDSVKINAKIFSNTICDGWGSLTLPDSSSYNCLGVKSNITINADIYVRTILGWIFLQNRVESINSYQWYAQGSKYYIANATLDTLGNMTGFNFRINAVPKTYFSKLVSITPDSAVQGQSLQVTIKGRNTFFTQGTNVSVYIGTMIIDSFKVMNDTTITAFIHSKLSTSTGLYNVRVYDPLAGYIYLNAPYFNIIPSPLAPRLLTVTPAYVIAGTSVNVNIFGIYTHFTKATNTVNISSSSGTLIVNSVSVINDTLITCKVLFDTIPHASCGVTVSNSVDGSIYLSNCFSTVSVGVNDLTPEMNLEIFPVPASLQLNLNCHCSKLLSICIINSCGRLVKLLNDVESEHSVDVSDLDEGIYLVQIKGDEFMMTRKIVISR